MTKTQSSWIAVACLSIAAASSAQGQLKINEVYYNVLPQGGNQFVELYNAGTSNVFLDGMVLTDEAGSGVEGVFKFPGSPGQTNLAVAPGQFVSIAVDATGATINANWECYAGGTDSDNPSVSNLTLVGGVSDLSLFAAGDNVILADGTDTTAPISQSTVVDGMNFAGGGGEAAPLSSSASDPDPNASATSGSSLSRCSDGNDTDASSSADFFARVVTAGLANNCLGPGIFISDATVVEGATGLTVNASFVVSLSSSSAVPITVNYFTTNGTASSGSDYTAIGNTLLTISAGVLSQTIVVVVNGDALAESNETFFVTLQTPTNGSIADAQGLGTILDDDTIHAFTSVGYSSGILTATWTTVNGLIYLPQFTTNAALPAWIDFGSPITAASSSATLTDTAAVLRVYRVLQLY